MKPGLYVPREMLERYSFEQSVVAAGLLVAYKKVMGNKGHEIVLPMSQLLEICGGPPDTVEDLEIVLGTLKEAQRIMYRIDAGVLTFWFAPDIAQYIRTYEVAVTVTVDGVEQTLDTAIPF